MKRISVMLLTMGLAASVLAGPPTVPATPAAVQGVEYARTFELGNGFRFTWDANQAQITEGTLLVLKVDPAYVLPRQTAEPVLYVGAQSAERINSGHESGYVVALVPGKVDLATTPIFFGTPELPESVTAEKAAAELAQAQAAGIQPFAAEPVKSAWQAGGRTLRAENHAELLRGEVSRLIVKYSPQEKNLADGYQLRPVRELKK